MADAPLAIVPAAEVPPRPGEWLCHERPWRHVVAFTLSALVAIGALAAPSAVADLPLAGKIVAYWIGGWAALFALMTYGGALGSLGPSGWRLRAAPDRLAVNLRSYQNSHFAADTPSILLLPRHAVRAVRPWRQDLTATHDEARLRHKVAALEIVLRQPAPELDAALAAERTRMGRVLFAIRSRSKHHPVQLDGTVLRVYWRGPQDNVTPGLDETLAQLARWYPTQGAALPGALDPEAELLELARAGDRLGAMTKARELYGMDVTEAKRFVEELAGKG